MWEFAMISHMSPNPPFWALRAVAAAAALVLIFSVSSAQQAKSPPEKASAVKAKSEPLPAPGPLPFNTVITKLKAGKQIFSNTIVLPDLEAAKKACEGQDFIWIEMQHSTLTWRETANLIEVIAAAGCIPFVRVPSANVGDIQKATDAG